MAEAAVSKAMGNFAGALAIYSDLLKEDSNNEAALLYSAQCLLALDRDSEAAAQYRRLSSIFQDRGKLMKAEHASRCAREFEPDPELRASDAARVRALTDQITGGAITRH